MRRWFQILNKVISGGLHDLVPFVQLKKRECRSVTISENADFSLQLY